MTQYKRVAQLKTLEEFRSYLRKLNVDIPIDEVVEHTSDAALAQPIEWKGRLIGNRFCVLPMEGWDGTEDGRPTELTRRRWRNFGLSGAKLIFGGEAVAVRHEGRANPRQLLMNDENASSIGSLCAELRNAHQQSFGSTKDLVIGLQLTHSGRFSSPEPDWKPRPRILYHHATLDRKHNLGPEYPLITDTEIREWIDDYVHAASLARDAGFDFVDIKHCHGYLGHEFLTAVDRPGPYGGSFENRTRFLREIAAGIRAEVPGLELGVRFSAFDIFDAGPEESRAFVQLLHKLDIRLLCVTGGSPYYSPHLIRPAMFPPSDGYQPPEDPLVGVARHIAVTADLKRHQPEMIVIGSGYSYLQEWIPNVSQAVVRSGMADSIGLGRMMLSYPEMMADILAGRPLARKRICRTFSDCTTAPRNHLVSGCYPLDDLYQAMPEAVQLKQIKLSLRG